MQYTFGHPLKSAEIDDALAGLGMTTFGGDLAGKPIISNPDFYTYAAGVLVSTIRALTAFPTIPDTLFGFDFLLGPGAFVGDPQQGPVVAADVFVVQTFGPVDGLGISGAILQAEDYITAHPATTWICYFISVYQADDLSQTACHIVICGRGS